MSLAKIRRTQSMMFTIMVQSVTSIKYEGLKNLVSLAMCEAHCEEYKLCL